MYDLIIIGSGPAGLGAAIYAKRAKTGAESPFSRANPIYALVINSVRAAGDAGAWP